MNRQSLLRLLLLVTPLISAAGQPRALAPDQLNWQTDPKTGVSRANLLGARNESGPFVQRVRLPPNFHPGLHRHDGDLNATVLSGRIHFRFADGPAQSLPAGSYLFIPAGLPHEEWADEQGAEFEARGMGPQSTELLPATKS
ncbi:MAG: cupin domain-containing protein [Stagnimonas sp.]|nr:cupin domain-containing protein [Stagnimonas sp.]